MIPANSLNKCVVFRKFPIHARLQSGFCTRKQLCNLRITVRSLKSIIALDTLLLLQVLTVQNYCDYYQLLSFSWNSNSWNDAITVSQHCLLMTVCMVKMWNMKAKIITDSTDILTKYYYLKVHLDSSLTCIKTK